MQASTLIGGLAGERTRWTEDSEKSADLKRRLVGDCALGSAFVSYCGPFNQEFRHYMVTDKFTADLQVCVQFDYLTLIFDRLFAAAVHDTVFAAALSFFFL